MARVGLDFAYDLNCQNKITNAQYLELQNSHRDGDAVCSCTIGFVICLILAIAAWIIWTRAQPIAAKALGITAGVALGITFLSTWLLKGRADRMTEHKAVAFMKENEQVKFT